MNIELMEKWFTNYALWRKEAEQEAIQTLGNVGYTKKLLVSNGSKLNVHDDGSIFWEWLNPNGTRNDFQSRWMNQKITAWKDSKYYVPID